MKYYIEFNPNETFCKPKIIYFITATFLKSEIIWAYVH